MKDLDIEMTERQLKYRRKINSVICICYCLVIILSSFHHHNFNFNCNKVVEEQNNSHSDSLAWKYDSGIKCIIHHNFISLQTLTISNSHSKNLNNREYLVRRVDIICTNLYRTYLYINHLRAPPLFS